MFSNFIAKVRNQLSAEIHQYRQPLVHPALWQSFPVGIEWNLHRSYYPIQKKEKNHVEGQRQKRASEISNNVVTNCEVTNFIYITTLLTNNISFVFDVRNSKYIY